MVTKAHRKSGSRAISSFPVMSANATAGFFIAARHRCLPRTVTGGVILLCLLLRGHSAMASTTYSGNAGAAYSAACTVLPTGPTGQSQSEASPGTVFANFTGLSCAGSAAATATIDAGNPNTVSASANTTTANIDAQAEAAIYGSFMVVGPQGQTVPVVVSASGSSTSSGTAGASGVFSILPSYEILSGCLSGDTSCLSESAINGGSFSVNQTLNETTNVMINVTAIASVSENTGGQNTFLFGAGSGSASVDPTIKIDPTFLASHPGYSLVFSDGYIVTPLPPSAVLLLSAITMFALFFRVPMRLSI